MKCSQSSSRRYAWCLALGLSVVGFACASPSGGVLIGSGGASGSGGQSASGGADGTGGSTNSGGQPGTGGTTSTGGQQGTGGTTGAGGQPDTGGTTGAGGQLDTGGATGSGGQTGTGGATGGRGGRTGTGGASATGGATGQPGTGGATGGRSGMGGSTAGGATGTGGAPGSGGSTGPFVGTKTPGTAQSGDLTINPATTYQTMDGFGIADVWQGKSTSSADQRKLFWDPENGIGMTLLRIGIDENGKIMGDAAFVEAPDVVKFGGKVWAAPWSPPASYKDNNNINNGGHLNTSSYEAWATTLAAFPAYFKQNAGVDLWGLSAQNEPDFTASYRSCIFSASQMNAFLKVLGPKLHALNPPVKVIAAEPDVWSHLWSNGDKYGVAIEGDATVNALVDVHATHDYGSNVQSTTRTAPPANVSHPIWQTEATYTAGAGIGPALDFDRCIYAAVTSGGTSGWVYWWTPEFLNGGSTSSPPKRVYAMGNFSKFVRPGYVRVGITGAPSSVQIVPFMSPADGTFAIVALNSGSSAVNVSFFVSGAGWPGTVTPYVTSASANLEAGTQVTVNAGRFSGSLAAQSITTFVGKQ
jgi:glucuronoarabinoxylan endo-1,4-beta-xylanase